MATTLNGVAVRGLRVIYSTEYRRVSIWKAVLFLKEPSYWDAHWHVLTVHDGPHNPVARRRFARKKDALGARDLFVDVVADMSQDAYGQADWQAVLDAV